MMLSILVMYFYHVHNLISNSLSLVQLVQKGYEAHMKDCHLWLQDQNYNLIAKVLLEG